MSTEKMKTDVIVVGAGAAGLIAALFALRSGAHTLLIDKNDKPGKKLYITGKGRCNVTNACSLDEFLSQVPRNPRFLYSALSRFTPEDMMNLLRSLNCDTKIERGRRVFPVSDKASDVTRALCNAFLFGGGQIRLNTVVKRLLIDQGSVLGVETDSGEQLPADRVILATGGLSYPSTGSTGDGYRFASDTGHRLVSPTPSLIPFVTEEDWPRQLQGLSLKNVTLTAFRGKKEIYSELGEMLFTHFGVSGPLFIELSSHISSDWLPLSVFLDLKPGLSEEQLSLRLQRDFAASGKKMLRSVLPSLLPQRLAEKIPALCGIPEDKCVSQISQPEREKIVHLLKALPLTLSAFRPIAEAIITRGGVDVRDINPKDMQSKIVKGLYFAGEMIDVDAHTGGFNLQIAFSTGVLSGTSAAQSLQMT